MHCKRLVEAHKLFYKWDYWGADPCLYDKYMKQKNWKLWTNPVLPVDEIKKLFDFIRGWDLHFQGDEEKFAEIYEEIYPLIKDLEHEKIEDMDVTDEELKRKIEDVFDNMAKCTPPYAEHQYESTDASKILNTILPNLFVMWDRKIRGAILGDEERKGARDYAYEFLPSAQEELEKAIKTCMEDKNLNRAEAIEYIREECDGETLAKLLDEYNYMKYTIRHPSLWLEESEKQKKFREFVESLKKKGVPSEEYRRLIMEWKED